jgi:hypothetical protein
MHHDLRLRYAAIILQKIKTLADRNNNKTIVACDVLGTRHSLTVVAAVSAVIA